MARGKTTLASWSHFLNSVISLASGRQGIADLQSERLALKGLVLLDAYARHTHCNNQHTLGYSGGEEGDLKGASSPRTFVKYDVSACPSSTTWSGAVCVIRTHPRRGAQGPLPHPVAQIPLKESRPATHPEAAALCQAGSAHRGCFHAVSHLAGVCSEPQAVPLRPKDAFLCCCLLSAHRARNNMRPCGAVQPENEGTSVVPPPFDAFMS